MIGERTLADLSWPALLELLAERCATFAGAARVRALPFLDSPSEALIAAERISEARQLIVRGDGLRFGGIEDLTAALDAVAGGAVLDASDLIVIGHTIGGWERLREQIDGYRSEVPRLSVMIGRTESLRDLGSRLSESFDDDGLLVDGASEALGGLRRTVSRLQGRIEEKARAILDDSRVASHLQERYYTQREDRYVVPVRVESRSHVKGIVHGTSQSGQTVFIEPEKLVELNNQLKMAEYAVYEEERRILRELTAAVAGAADAMRECGAVVTAIDAVSASARLAEEMEARAPVIADEGVDLRRAFHPLMVLSERGCIPNDIRVDAGQVLVISGPNAGGKTVALKTLGMVALMTRAGLHVPVGPESKIPWFESVETDIGDSQSIENELSTFSGHIANLQRMLTHGTPRSLLLIDEVAAATEPEQGAALAQAVLEAIAERRIPAVVTTHYERLKLLAASDPRFANASVGFNMEKMEPTFKLHLGVPGSSGALDVARRLGMAEEVLGRALDLIGDERARVDTLMQQLSDERRRLDAELEAAAAARRESEQATAAARQAEKSLREKQRKLHDQAHGEAVAALRDARIELDRLRKGVRRRQRSDEVKAAEKTVDALARSVGEHAPEPEALPGRAAEASDLTSGARVYVVPLASEGQVAGPVDRKRVPVQVGALRTTQTVADLRILPPKGAGKGASKGKKKEKKRAAGPEHELVAAPRDGKTTVRTPDITLDLRGQRVDDALAEIDKFLDKSLLSSREVIFVIHGHGTGALREAVRTHLKAHPAVDAIRPGEQNEGGDGVTIAWLD